MADKKLKVAETSDQKPATSKLVAKQVIRGLVVEVGKLTQTVTVLVERRKMHPLYKKAVKRTKRFLVHDPLGVKEGDLVEMHQCRLMSKNKHWLINEVVGQDLGLMVGEQLQAGVDEAIAEVMPEQEIKESSDVSLQTGDKEIKEVKKVKKVSKRKVNLTAES